MKASSLLLTFLLSVLMITTHAQQSAKQPLVSLNTFKNPPVEGCADYFYLSKNDDKNNRYVCVRDFAKIAWLKINGKFEQLIYKPGKDLNNAVYANTEYSLNIKVTSKRQSGPESYRLKGVLIISKRDKIIITKNVTGFGGC